MTAGQPTAVLQAFESYEVLQPGRTILRTRFGKFICLLTGFRRRGVALLRRVLPLLHASIATTTTTTTRQRGCCSRGSIVFFSHFFFCD